MKSYVEGSKQPLILSLKHPVKEKSVMGKEPNGHQPEPLDLQTPVMVENDEIAVANLLSFPASPFLTNPSPAANPPSMS
jgi:hypothetical protein